MNAVSPLLKHQSTSHVLNESISGIDKTDNNKQRLSLTELFSLFEQRSFAGIFFILAMLCLLPGISVLAGFAMILPSVQFLLGLKKPLLPQWLMRRSIPVERWIYWSQWLVPKLQWQEQWLKPRWLFLSSSAARILIGFVALILAIIVAIPFPLSNFLPAFAMLFISLGLLERDGVYIAIGLIIGLVAMILSLAVVKSILLAIGHFIVG